MRNGPHHVESHNGRNWTAFVRLLVFSPQQTGGPDYVRFGYPPIASPLSARVGNPNEDDRIRAYLSTA